MPENSGILRKAALQRQQIGNCDDGKLDFFTEAQRLFFQMLGCGCHFHIESESERIAQRRKLIIGHNSAVPAV